MCFRAPAVWETAFVSGLTTSRVSTSCRLPERSARSGSAGPATVSMMLHPRLRYFCARPRPRPRAPAGRRTRHGGLHGLCGLAQGEAEALRWLGRCAVSQGRLSPVPEPPRPVSRDRSKIAETTYFSGESVRDRDASGHDCGGETHWRGRRVVGRHANFAGNCTNSRRLARQGARKPRQSRCHENRDRG